MRHFVPSKVDDKEIKMIVFKDSRQEENPFANKHIKIYKAFSHWEFCSE